MRRLFRWALYAFIVVVVLIVAGVLLLDTMARSVAESRIRADTGMDVKIGKLVIGLATPTITIEQFRIYNTAEFGGSPFVEMPELHLEYDREALYSGKLHLKLARLNLAEVHVVENKDGKTNVQDLQKKQPKPSNTSTNKPGAPPLEFLGIDTLNITISKAKFTSARNPAQNREVNFGIKNEVFRNVKTEKDLETIAVALALKGGANFLMGGIFNPSKVTKDGSTAGKETKKILESLVAPLQKK